MNRQFVVFVAIIVAALICAMLFGDLGEPTFPARIVKP